MMLYDAFAIFIKHQYAVKRAELPFESTPSAVLAALAKDWTELPEKKKAGYRRLVYQDQDRYDREMRDILTEGFYIQADGSLVPSKPESEGKLTKSQPTSDAQKNKLDTGIQRPSVAAMIQ